jgi:hypothetical protein
MGLRGKGSITTKELINLGGKTSRRDQTGWILGAGRIVNGTKQRRKGAWKGGSHLRQDCTGVVIKRDALDLDNSLMDEACGPRLDTQANDFVFIRSAPVRPGGDVVITDNPLCVKIVRLNPTQVKEFVHGEDSTHSLGVGSGLGYAKSIQPR